MSANLIWLLWEATLQTLYMVAASTVLGMVFGLPLGVFLATSQRGELLSAPWLNKMLGPGGERHAVGALHHPGRGDHPANPRHRRHVHRHQCGHRAPDPGRDPLHRAPCGKRHPRGRCRPDRGRPRHGRNAHADHHKGPGPRGPARHRARPDAGRGQPDRLFRHGRRGRRRGVWAIWGSDTDTNASCPR